MYDDDDDPEFLNLVMIDDVFGEIRVRFLIMNIASSSSSSSSLCVCLN